MEPILWVPGAAPLFYAGEEGRISLAAHLRAADNFYSHDGIYAGRDPYTGCRIVIHLSGDQRKDTATATVRESSLEEFAAGRTVSIVPDDEPVHPPHIAIARARSMLGQGGYSILDWNCETFVRWARSGRRRSEQVRGAVVLALLCVGVVLLARSG